MEAFKDFVPDKWDRLNVASYSGPEAERGVEKLTTMLREGALRRELEELGAHVPPPKRKRGGQRKHAGDEGMSLRLAIRDVERMRAIFRAHWGKVNRHHRPTREDIAAEFHGLTMERSGR